MSNPFRAPHVPGPVGKQACADLWDRVTEQIAGTSTTSLTIGTGVQSLNVGPDKQFAVGQVVRIADNTDPVGTWMQGTVTGYDPVTGVLDVDVTSTDGSGTHSDWTVSLSGGVGPAGPEGPEGPQGPAGPPNSLSIGTVTSGPSAGATITGTAPSQTLNLVLPKGDKGDQGDAGAAATISVGTVATGAAGSSASVVNAGTTAAAVLNFSIPRGDKGETGDVGPQGDPGADGADGWAPILATVADGARYVHQIADWTGGTGTKPATGGYIGPAGIVSAIGDAVNIRGAAGSGSGDVSGPAGATDGHVALFDGATGKLLKDGGPLALVATSGSYTDLADKPTIPAAQQQTDWNATSGITSIANKPAVIAAGANQASARTAIGAGTSNLAIGTTSTTAKAGDYAPTAAEIAAATFGATAKATPVDADTLLITDSAASNGAKKLTWANLKATLKTYTDTLYRAVGWVPTWGDVTGKPTFGTAAAQDSTAFATAAQGAKADAALPAISGTTQGVSATYIDKGSVASGTVTLSFADGEHQRVQATGNITLALSNIPAAGKLMEMQVEAANFGGKTITWPTVNWVKSDGTTTTTTSANGVTWQASGTDWVLLWTRDGGTTVYGKVMR